MANLYKNKTHRYYLLLILLLCLEEILINDPLIKANILLSLPRNFFFLSYCFGNIFLVLMHYIYNILPYIQLKDPVTLRLNNKYQAVISTRIVVCFLEVFLLQAAVVYRNLATYQSILQLLVIQGLELIIFLLTTYLFKKRNFSFILITNIASMFVILSVINKL